MTGALSGRQISRRQISGRQTGYLAPDGYLEELLAELGEDARAVHGRLALADGPPRHVAWVDDVWYEPRTLEVDSVRDAARQLRVLGRTWAPYSVTLHRRTELVARELPAVEAPPLRFPSAMPRSHLGAFTLLDEQTVLAAPETSSPFPNGEVRFVEDRRGPPSRAYLKLWEAFARLGSWPAPGETVLDLGASPGGWSWACAELGARVLAVDKAPLAPNVASRPNVTALAESAFGLDPRAVGPVDWLLSDVICYPRRLLGLLRRWLASGMARRFVCTIKFQGPTDHEVARELAAIEGSTLVHLHHNAHELTWMRPG